MKFGQVKKISKRKETSRLKIIILYALKLGNKDIPMLIVHLSKRRMDLKERNIRYQRKPTFKGKIMK